MIIKLQLDKKTTKLVKTYNIYHLIRANVYGKIFNIHIVVLDRRRLLS